LKPELDLGHNVPDTHY